jgi:diguanylate cyclase (GGDEF)-like protein
MLTLKNIINGLEVGVAVIQNGMHLTEVNPAFWSMIGIEKPVTQIEQLIQQCPANNDIKEEFKLFLMRIPNNVNSLGMSLDSGKYLEFRLKRLSAQGAEAVDLLTVQDLTLQEIRIQQLIIESEYDELTGVANRRKFEREFQRKFDFSKRTGCSGALVLFDIDRFKSINDRFGHVHGDDILKLIGPKVSPLIRNYEMLARVGGDEFAILVSHSGQNAIQRLLMHVPVALNSIQIGPSSNPKAEFLKITMGYSIFPINNLTKSDIYMEADRVLYKSKVTKNPAVSKRNQV